jgi:hypothetical protein
MNKNNGKRVVATKPTASTNLPQQMGRPVSKENSFTKDLYPNSYSYVMQDDERK